MSTRVRDDDLREGLDGFLGDMADHQREQQGKLPTPDANRELAVVEFEKLEKQMRAQPAIAAPPASADKPPARETKHVEGKAYTVTRDDATGPLLEQPLTEKQETLRILKRIYLLLTLEDEGILGAPSWKKRVIAVLDKCGGTMGATTLNPARLAKELDEVLEASNKYFGDWRKDPDRKIIVGA